MGPPAANSSSNKSADNNDETTTTATTITKTSNSGNNNNGTAAARSIKKSSDSDLKGSVIEFMKARPFLWNKRHPGYKDHKKRDHEFQQFSTEIGFSIQEIKRVWHVLRTNFFRAHKILSDKPQIGQLVANGQNGTEKVWKYYTAMLYILEGSNLESRTRPIAATSKGGSCSSQLVTERAYNNNNSNSTPRKVSNRAANNVTSPAFKDTQANGVIEGSSRTMIMYNGTPIASADTSSANTPTSKLSTFNDSVLDDDDDFLYARSLSLTLRKFDPTTKEVVKLKFQEIIVEYMQQRQQQQQQQQLLQRQLNHQQPQPQQQLSQLEPPPPSEIANMEASLVVKKPANDVT